MSVLMMIIPILAWRFLLVQCSHESAIVMPGSDEELLSPDSFLDAIDNGIYDPEMIITPRMSINASVQTNLSSVTIDELMKDYLKKDLRLNLREDFSMPDLKDFLTKKPIIKAIIENNLNRRNKFTAHNKEVKEFVECGEACS